MKNKFLAILCIILAFFMTQMCYGEDIEELNTYFEIRDTIKLMNSEMENGIKTSNGPSLFDEKDIDLKIESFIGFMKNRINNYALSDSKLKFLYVKKLDALIQETQTLYAQAKPIIHLKKESKQVKVEKVIPPVTYATITHPYFDSIDFRTLASREPLNDDPKEILAVAAIPAPEKEEPKTDKKEIKAAAPQKVANIKTDNTSDKITKQNKPSDSAKLNEKEKSDEKATAKVALPKDEKIKAENNTANDFMRPMAIMVENHNQARPQSGLYLADVLYEMPVEGGITRFMGIFTKAPSLIGPVRSCREYFVDRALEVDALYVHCGGSPMGYAYLSKSKIRSIDEIKNSSPFFRDKVRKAPHNLYGKGESIYKYMAKRCDMRVATQPVVLDYGKRTESGEAAGDYLKINYHGNYNVICKYENGVYHRYMNNILHLDRETQKPLQASAIVLQTAAMRTVDSVGRQEISFIGSGTAYIFENGRRTKVTWQKAAPRSKTVYYDAKGNEYLFAKNGQIWIQVVSPNHKVFFEPQKETAKSEPSKKSNSDIKKNDTSASKKNADTAKAGSKK